MLQSLPVADDYLSDPHVLRIRIAKPISLFCNFLNPRNIVSYSLADIAILAVLYFDSKSSVAPIHELMTENESSEQLSIQVVGTMWFLATMTQITHPLPIKIKYIFLLQGVKVCYLNRSRKLTVNRAYGADAASADSFTTLSLVVIRSSCANFTSGPPHGKPIPKQRLYSTSSIRAAAVVNWLYGSQQLESI